MSKQVSVVPIFDFDTVSYEKDTEVHLDVTLIAPERETQKRIPLHLILSVDCSGSMDGNKLTQVKSTLCKLIDHLTENDTLGILGFSENAWEELAPLPMTKESKNLAKTKVNGMYVRGMTNLEAAIKMSLEKATIADQSKTSRVILLTDGLPTTGNCNKQELIKLSSNTNQMVSISCFGYGDDFDAELMASLSKMGRGNNFYIKSDDDCAKAFGLELGGLLSLFGQNIKISINPSGNMRFKEMLSEYKCDQVQGYRLLTENSKIEIIIDDIYVGETKHCILKLEIPKATEAVCARPTTVGKIDVTYIDTESKIEQTLSISAKIKYEKSVDKIPNEPHPEVRKQLAIIEAVKFQREAKKKADAGDLAGARVILGEAVNYINTNAEYIPNSASYAAAYSCMVNDFSNNHSYQTRGVKSMTSFRYATSTGRGASTDTLSFSTLSKAQGEMMKSFSSPPTSDDEEKKA